MFTSEEAREMAHDMKLAACGFEFHDESTGNDHHLAARDMEEAVTEARGLMSMRGIAGGQVHAVDPDGGLVESKELDAVEGGES